MKDSKFQVAIYDFITKESGNLVVDAVAGSGKTTTILNCLKRTPEKASKIFVAFNNAIVDELKERISGIDSKATVSTMHSICWRALMKHYKYQVKLNPNKSIKHIEKECKKLELPPKKVGFMMFTVSRLLDLIRQNLVDINDYDSIDKLSIRFDLEFDEQIFGICKNVYTLMNKSKKEFDFTDMIFRVILDEIDMPKFDFVFVDESQDLSTLQHMIIKKLIANKGRLIAVGDPRQAIYGFAGADSDSYDNLKNLLPNTSELPLSVNYRCSQSVVRHAQSINPNILPFKKNKEGEVNEDAICSNIVSGDWVLCRNVKPLIVMNLYFLMRGVKSFVKGKDIGKGLEIFIKKMHSSTLDGLLKKIDLSVETEANKLRKKGVRNPFNTEKIDRMVQRNDAIKLLSQNVHGVDSLLKYIRSVFKEEGEGVCLSTIHKSKGLENKNVFLLCPELIPSKYATQEWQLVQEENLKYVAITRAKENFSYITDYEKIEKQIAKKLKE